MVVPVLFVLILGVGATVAFWSTRALLPVSKPLAAVVFVAVIATVILGTRSFTGAVLDAGTQLLEDDLAERYGVPIQYVAGDVWRIGGQLHQGTLVPRTRQLFVDGTELGT